MGIHIAQRWLNWVFFADGKSVSAWVLRIRASFAVISEIQDMVSARISLGSRVE